MSALHGLPVAGTVLRYSYLWSYEDQRGFIEGRKNRPAVLVIANDPAKGSCVVLPITHREPESPTIGIEIPEVARARLGLDDRRQWVILSEGNAFVWPGPDLRAIPNSDPPTAIYGKISKSLYVRILTQMQALIRAKRLRTTLR